MKPHEEFVQAVVKLINDKDLQKSVLSGADKSDYKKLKEAAALDRKQAQKELTAASEKADDIIGKARNNAVRIERDAAAKVEQKYAQLQDKVKKIEAKAASLGEKESEIAAREAAVKDLEKEKRICDAKTREADQKEALYNQKIADLEAAGVAIKRS